MRNFPLCPLHQSHCFTILCVGPVSPVFREKCRSFRKCLRAVWDELHAPLTFLFLCFPMRFAFSRIVTVTVEIHSIHSYSSTQNLQNHTSHPTTHPQKRNRSTQKLHWPLSLKLIFQHCLKKTRVCQKCSPFWEFLSFYLCYLRLKMKAIQQLKNLDRWFVTNLWVSERVTFSLTIHQQNCQAYTNTQTYSPTWGETSYFRNKSQGFASSLWQKAITFTWPPSLSCNCNPLLVLL